jgi:putative ABC transport system substrate-binding protein
MITRRKFLIGVSASAFALHRRAVAQSTRRVPKVGWLVPGTATSTEVFLEAFRQGMRELGYVEGKAFVTEYRFADGQLDRLPELAADLVELHVDVIVTSSTPGALAAKHATRSIPIVFAASSDPVGAGVVRSLAQPGGNVTGVSNMASDLSGKRLELLQAIVPKMSRAAILWDASNTGMALRVRETKLAADHSGIVLLDAGARNLQELEAAFAGIMKQRPNAVLVTAEPFTRQHQTRLLEFVTRNGIPAMYEESTFVEAGGLMSYGPSSRTNFRHAATYVVKILKGANPASLPVEQPTKFELFVNLKTANALGIKVPQSVLLRADKVIE